MEFRITGNTLTIESNQVTTGGGSARTVQHWMMKARMFRCKRLVVSLPNGPLLDEIRTEMSMAASRLNLAMSRRIDVDFVTRSWS